MTPRLINAKYLSEYKIKALFEDGKVGVIYLENELWSEVFKPLKGLSVFQKFKIDPEPQTIVWPTTGAVLSPEFLWHRTAA